MIRAQLGAIPEKGTFTPALSNIGDGTYTAQVGTYTKIGDLVTCTVNVNVAVLGTAAGDVVITGLPFTSHGVSNAQFTSSTIWGQNWTTARINIVGFLSTSSTSINIKYGSSSTGTLAFVQHSELDTGNIIFNITYKVTE